MWYSVLPYELGCVVLEVKSGPYSAKMAKELAPWAPEEGTEFAKIYYEKFRSIL